MMPPSRESPHGTNAGGPTPDAYTHYSPVMIAALSKTAGRSAFDEGVHPHTLTYRQLSQPAPIEGRGTNEDVLATNDLALRN